MPENEEKDIEELKKEKLEEIEGDKDQQKEREEQQLKQMAKEYMTKEARSRLGNIRAANPQKAKRITQQIIRLGQTGQLKGKIEEEQLKQILKSVGNQEDNKSNIKFRR